ncbi:class I SAM-dependent methyltransferase [Bacillus sp. UNC438CL73TsuS30]|uniref:class I SAM-dependent methyltransferase n=1 Tax=Bacillus sp. UNC438CL73TsuS30 TaxID=1340434 RepID=UPI00047B5B4E|nr:class I SAM-dependent methyltransferase [Bacillus sp. UNC438CL73TsuS30]
MFVTTAGRTNEQMIEKARNLAETLDIPYIPRKKKPISQIQKEASGSCLIVGKERLELYNQEHKEPFFFHPNSAMFRIKRLLNGDQDPFIEAADLSSGMSILDCTLGLASDAIVASFVVGLEGSVTGIEGQKYLSFLVKEGLQSWDSGYLEINSAMKRIKVNTSFSLDYLKSLPSSSINCVYFDPMFEESILESDGIRSLGNFALQHDLNEETISEARRVCKQKVILKDHYKSQRFEKYGFTVFRRKTAKFHFGILEK